MIANWLIRLLLAEYIVIAITALLERRVVVAVYWVGAAILNWAVLAGMR